MPLTTIGQKWQMVIGGEHVDSLLGEQFEVFSPATGKAIAQVPRGKAADIDRAVRSASDAFADRCWTNLSARDRERILWRLAELLEQHSQALGEIEALNVGRSPVQMRDVGTRAAVAIRYNAGCTCVLKPAEETPLSALCLAELCLEAGVPPGVVNVVTGTGEEAGAPLAAHPAVDKVSFTGSTEVGRLLIKASGESNLKKLTLELGGKSPMIVFRDAELKAAIQGAARGIYSLAGQVCTAASRLFVEESIFEQVVDGVADFGSKLRVGSSDDAEMGPLISRKQLDRVQGYVESGLSDGAKAVIGGRPIPGDGYFFEPTVMVNVNQDMKIVREEIFGPVVCVLPFSSEEEVVAAANDSSYGLAGSVWTRDLRRAIRATNQLRVGRVGINNHPGRELSMPTGGVRQSGWGRECGAEGIDQFLETKSVYIA